MSFNIPPQDIDLRFCADARSQAIRSYLNERQLSQYLRGQLGVVSLVRGFGRHVRRVGDGHITLREVTLHQVRDFRSALFGRLDYLEFEDAQKVVEVFTGGRMRLEIGARHANLVWNSELLGSVLGGLHASRVAVYGMDEGRVISTYDLVAYIEDAGIAWGNRLNLLRARRGIVTVEQPRHPAPRSGGGDLRTYVDRIRDRNRSEADLSYEARVTFGGMTILPSGTLSSRRWGIEVEAVDIGGIDTPQGWRLHGDGSLEPVYVGSNGESYLDQHDPDCSAYDGEDYGCDEYDACIDGGGEYTQVGEWNSPILRSFHSRGLAHICSELQGRASNSSPGIHVHVEATDLTADQAVRVAMFYTMLEPLFENGYERETRSYCQSMTGHDLLDHIGSARDFRARNLTDVRQFRGGDRYRSVNLSALSSHGTIEFRAMGPVYEYETLIRWAAFCREMVNLGKSNVPQRAVQAATSMQDIIDLFARYGRETPAAPEVTPTLGSENRRAPHREVQNDGIADVFDDYAGALASSMGR